MKSCCLWFRRSTRLSWSPPPVVFKLQMNIVILLASDLPLSDDKPLIKSINWLNEDSSFTQKNNCTYYLINREKHSHINFKPIISNKPAYWRSCKWTTAAGRSTESFLTIQSARTYARVFNTIEDGKSLAGENLTHSTPGHLNSNNLKWIYRNVFFLFLKRLVL